MDVIRTEKLVKKYGDSKVVDELNLQIEEGDIYGLLGPNGAGKSTTISMICNILRPTSGNIYIYNQNVKEAFSKVRTLIGLVPQNIALYQQYTAEDNVKLFAQLYKVKREELKSAVHAALEATGLTDVATKTAGKFSGGMLRRLNIACALAHNPKILIMDEPTVGIDPQSRNYILETIRKLNEGGTTILYCSHYMEEVEALCNKISILDKGKEIIKGTKEELKAGIDARECLKISGGPFTPKILDEIGKIDGVISVRPDQNGTVEIDMERESGEVGEIVNLLTNSGAKITHIRHSEVTLETVFLALTGKKLRD